ncbi:hypothetical protein [Actinomadura fibrosa]|uniref:Uncharacterized protein n=1 Tax=Actinomadura fibrosa TaxID=111802 RepID=A0ABW2XE21_9ACTN|nr:hypothetical protein [Actinomadura fibrosa]
MSLSRRREARRRRHRAAVLGASAPGRGGLPERAAPPLDVVTGTILDASPHLLVVRADAPYGGAVSHPDAPDAQRITGATGAADPDTSDTPGDTGTRSDTGAPDGTCPVGGTGGTSRAGAGGGAGRTSDTGGPEAAAPGFAAGAGFPVGAEIRLPMSDGTSVWHGGRGGLAALRPGREVIVRPKGDGLGADRVWVDIGRVTGTILACGRDTVEVDMGPHRGRTHVVIPPHALERVLVRHPRLEPGYLIDVICVRAGGVLQAVRPGTSQPGYRADDLAAPEASAPVPEVLHGTATWFGFIGAAAQAGQAARAGVYEGTWPYLRDGGLATGAGEQVRPSVRSAAGRHGAAYPAVDPEGDGGGCADAPSGCAAMPFLSLGSDVAVHNECSGRTATVPVIECGCVAARYCDRCVECGTSPRGRIVELTPAAFVSLGGDLDAGCFNALVRPGTPGAPGTSGASAAPLPAEEGRAGRW